MINREFIEFRTKLKSSLSPMRYEHSLSVSFICVALAMRYGIDLQKAEAAGLLHDCAKCYSDRELFRLCEKRQIALSEDERLAPAVIHARYGAWMAEHEYGIRDPEILEAIRWHTTGKPAMSRLDMILYIADYIEPRREKAANLQGMRRMAFISLEETIYEMLRSSLNYLRKKGSHINTMTKEAFDYYKKESKHQKGDIDAV